MFHVPGGLSFVLIILYYVGTPDRRGNMCLIDPQAHTSYVSLSEPVMIVLNKLIVLILEQLLD